MTIDPNIVVATATETQDGPTPDGEGWYMLLIADGMAISHTWTWEQLAGFYRRAIDCAMEQVAATSDTTGEGDQ